MVPEPKLGVAVAAIALVTLVPFTTSCSSAAPTPVEPFVEAETGTPSGVEPLISHRRELAHYGPEHVGVTLPGEDVCDKDAAGQLKNPIAPGTYRGLLQNARCEQQKFLTMARVAKALGVDCDHCHAPDPSDPTRQIYTAPTENKRIANWMYATFVQGLRPRDGGVMMCASCHQATPEGQARAHILGEPRDPDRSQEWMHEVMTTDFVQADGERLRCKTCHVGLAPETAGWRPEVISEVSYGGGALQRREASPSATSPATSTDATEGARENSDTDANGGDTDANGGDTDANGGDTDANGGDTDANGDDTDANGDDTDVHADEDDG